MQLGASLVILGLLWWQADPSAVLAALALVSWPWFLAACGVEAVVLVLRSVRVAAAVGVGIGAGTRAALGLSVLNLVAPARAADVIAGAILGRATGAGVVRALAAYGAIVIADMFVHAVWLICAVLLAGGLVDQVRQVQTLSVVATGLLGLAVAVTVARRLLARRPEGSGRLVDGLRATLAQLTLRQIAAGSVQLVLVIVLFRLNLVAVGAELDQPWMAAALCQALGAVGAFLMPAAMGAGTATASSVILPLLGATEAQGVAFGVLLWVTATVPDLVIGLPLFLRVRAT